MIMKTSLIFVKDFCFLVLVVVWNNEVCVEAGDIFDVTKYGAVSNGKTDSSKAFLDAWKAACMAGGTMLIPEAGGTFKVNSLAGKGVCRGEVTVQVDGVVKASDGNNRYDSWFSFHHVHGLTINGSGTFDGNGHSAWGKGPDLARSLALYGCTNVYVKGITSLNSKGFHFAIEGSKTITFKNVTIKAPIDSPNTDGIHVQGSDNVQIISSPIGTGDDCISIGEGSTNINITGVDCGPGHGFSIGSIGKQKNEKDVRGIHIQNSSVTRTQNGVRIKTWSPSPSSVSVYDVTFQDIQVNNAKYPVVIDQHYCGGHKDCDRDSSRVQVSNVKFNGIKGTSASQLAVKLDCSESKPCQGIEMDNINLRLNDGGKTTSKCDNANVTYSGPQNPPPCRS